MATAKTTKAAAKPFPWGDPSTEAFKQKHIRESRVAGSVALVNRQIVGIATQLLTGLAAAQADVPAAVISWDPEGSDAQKLGLSIRIPLPFNDEIDELLKLWGFEGFALEDGGPPEFRFVGSPEDAERLNDLALAAKTNDLDQVDVSGEPVIQWPGWRDLVIGDTGADVKFLQLVLGAKIVDGTVSEDLIQKVRVFQERRGGIVTGLIDRDLWKRIIPRRLPPVYSGDTGWPVRVLQAGLLAYGFGETPVTGIFGVRSVRDIRQLQKDHGIRTGTFARMPEWQIILGPPRWPVWEAEENSAPPEEPELTPAERELAKLDAYSGPRKP